MTSQASKVLQDYIFVSKYARYLPKEKRRETLQEAVDRVRGMILNKYEGKGIDDEINWAYDLMAQQRVLGSQRALQYGGDPILKKNARLYNCVGSYADRPRFFQEYFWLLLCGCGAGFSVQKHHTRKMPSISLSRRLDMRRPIQTYTIPDTIEGWADSVGVLLTTYFDVPTSSELSEWVGKTVQFDYSLIREKGSLLGSGVGKAPGPDGLRLALDKIRCLLDKFIDDLPINDRSSIVQAGQFLGNTKYEPSLETIYDGLGIPIGDRFRLGELHPIHIYDIAMHISDAVLSGGVRRSATIALFSPDDTEMANAKTGNWFNDNPQRARSNNSALLIRGKVSRKEFSELMTLVKECGEPGFVWADSPEFLVNPCVEIGFFSYDIINDKLFQEWKKDHAYEAIECHPNDIGLETGWQGCNLSTLNCSELKGDTQKERLNYYLENAKAAAIIGTCQAGFTDFGYLTQASSNIFKREALIGVSMTGMMDNYEIVLNPKVQEQAAQIVLETNAYIADKIGINPAARNTCLKPEGSGTLLLKVGAHGCHPHHYVRYLKAVQANRMETPFQYFSKFNSQACEKSLWSAMDTDEVIYFPIEVPDGAKTKNQVPALELLKLVRSTQKHWVMPGKRPERCTMPWLTHNVSNTITINPEEWDDVEKFVFDNNQHFAGISFVPDSADKDYVQAPNCAVYTPRQIVKEYGDAALWTSGLIESGLYEFKNLWTACMALLEQKQPTTQTQIEYILRGHKFADKYFGGDMKRLTYCMKDVFNWKRWTDLRESLQVVDYTQCFEDHDDTKLEETIACSGGACLI